MADDLDKLPIEKMFVGSDRKCRLCNVLIGEMLYTDGTRRWLTKTGRDPFCWSLDAEGHDPWEVVPTDDAKALEAWLNG